MTTPPDRPRPPAGVPAAGPAAPLVREVGGWLWSAPVFGFLLTLTILKGIRMPSRWAVTHMLFGYDTGFMKRALWGEALARTLGSWTANYLVLAAVGLIVFFALILILVRHATARLPAPERVPFLLVFSASPAVAMFAHLAGYLEQVVYLAWLAVLVQRRSWRLQVAAAAAAAAALPLVHEAAILWVGGLTGLALLSGPAARSRPPGARLAAAALVGIVWIGSTGLAVWGGRVSPERADALRESRTRTFEVRPRQDAFATLTVTLDRAAGDMSRRWAERDMQVDLLFSLAVFAPGALVLGLLAVREARRLDPSRPLRAAAIGLLAFAVAGPLVLHAAGWDLHRWNALAAFNAALAALVLLTGRPAGASHALGARPTRFVAIALIVAAWGVAADPVFFDGYWASHPPFGEKVQFLIEAIRTGDRDLWLPRPGQ